MTSQIVTTESLVLTRTKAPALPVAPTEYSRQYIDQLNNVLRLYFSQLDNFVGQLTANGSNVTSNIVFPHGAFHQDGYTTLSTTIPNPTSTANIVVASTTGFQNTGTLLIGAEFISYSGATSNTFTGITRGMYSSTASSHNAGVYVSEAQAVANSTTALAVIMSATDASEGVRIDPADKTKIVFDYAGYYNIQFSIQLLTFDGEDNVVLWFKQNGDDVANSAGVVTVPATHGGQPGAAIVSWNLVLPLNANDYIQLYMASNTGNSLAATYPPGTAPVHPASPAVILTATFASAL
jgi:hypothetical protein